MKNVLLPFLLALTILYGCASRGGLGSVEHLGDISRIDTSQTITKENAGKILEQYIIDFTIPDPLVGSSASGGSLFEEGNEAVINCRAVMLDDFSTEADILYNCRVDSLEGEACGEYRKRYEEDYLRDGMFRVLIVMESFFSPKSMEPEYWAMYLETPDGVMVEPTDRFASPVQTVEDSIYSERNQRNYFRRTMTRNITLYFRKTTFFGEDLLGGDKPYLMLVLSREQRTVARVAWKLNDISD